jgi:single-strand DNA-binding protein
MKGHTIGRLVKDPVLKPVNDTHVCEFTLAVNRYRGKGDDRKQDTHFFDCVAWDSGAEVIAKYCNKGDKIFVETLANQDKWEDKETGGKRSKIVFRVTSFELLPKQTKQETATENGGESKDSDEQAPF